MSKPPKTPLPNTSIKRLASISHSGDITTTREDGPQGDHVTAYGVINKAVKYCADKIYTENKVEEGRNHLLNILKGLFILNKENNIDPIQHEVTQSIEKYEEKRTLSIDVSEIAGKFPVDSQEARKIKETAEDTKTLAHNILVEELLHTTLLCFNKIAGISYPRIPGHEPYSSESWEVKNALSFLIKEEKSLTDATQTSASHAESSHDNALTRRRSFRSNAGARARKIEEETKQAELYNHVKNLFFYPKITDLTFDLQDLTNPHKHDQVMTLAQQGLSQRNNSAKILIDHMARHLFLVHLCFPSWEHEKNNILDSFTYNHCKEWGINDAHTKFIQEQVSVKLEELQKEMGKETNHFVLKATPDQRTTQEAKQRKQTIDDFSGIERLITTSSEQGSPEARPAYKKQKTNHASSTTIIQLSNTGPDTPIR